MDLLNVRLGFGFSAGLFDYVLSFGKATQAAVARADRPGVLRRCTTDCSDSSSRASISRRRVVRSKMLRARASDAGTQDDAVQGWIRALGGASNLVAVDACTTRLRLSIADQKAVNEAALKSLGARGLVRPSQQTLQVVVGPIADQLASSIRAGLKLPASVASTAPAAAAVEAPATPCTEPDLGLSIAADARWLRRTFATCARPRAVCVSPCAMTPLSQPTLPSWPACEASRARWLTAFISSSVPPHPACSPN